VLELREDEHGFDDIADGRRADADVLDSAPPLGHQREAAFSLVAQDRSSALRVLVSMSSSLRAGFFTGTCTPAPAPSYPEPARMGRSFR
jgi:hypothetical protein